MSVIVPIMFVLGVALGFLLGLSVAALIFRANEIGTLRVDASDPDAPPCLFLEVNRGKFDTIQKSRRVCMAVSLLYSLPRR